MRAVDEWNKCSKNVVSAQTVDSFKRRLDKCMAEGDGWKVLSVQKLPCVGHLAFSSLLICPVFVREMKHDTTFECQTVRSNL